MRHTEFWERMELALGGAYAHTWARTQVIATLGGRTPDEALAAGVPPKQVWHAVWENLGLPASQK
jgi:hypothetical protein